MLYVIYMDCRYIRNYVQKLFDILTWPISNKLYIYIYIYSVGNLLTVALTPSWRGLDRLAPICRTLIWYSYEYFSNFWVVLVNYQHEELIHSFWNCLLTKRGQQLSRQNLSTWQRRTLSYPVYCLIRFGPFSRKYTVSGHWQHYTG